MTTPEGTARTQDASRDYAWSSAGPGVLQPGTPAPGFTLHLTQDPTVSLSDFRGPPVVLAFYAAFGAARRLHFPLLADSEPTGAVAGTCGAHRSRGGVAGRALFVPDGRGVAHRSYQSPIGVNPGADGTLEALDSLPATARSA